MPERIAHAEWKGSLREGKGTMGFGSGAFDGQYSFASRFENGSGTNPEELIGAAEAGCFSMAFANELSKAGFVPDSVRTTAKVHLGSPAGGGFAITKIELSTDAQVRGIDRTSFEKIAQEAKKACPVSKALTGTEITLEAKLTSGAASR
jgi:osmotically inducible protein OsmC